MNILEVCLSSGLGGLELYVFRVSQALTDSQLNKNTVITIVNPGSKLDNHYRKNSRTNIEYIKPFFNHLPLLNAKKLAAIIDNNNIDIIHMHWGKDLPLVAFAKIFSKRKPAFIYTRHMIITRTKSDFYHNFLYRQLDLLLTITEELGTLCKKYIPLLKHKITTLYHGVKQPQNTLNKNSIRQQREKIGFSKNDFIIGLIGRLEERKGQHLLIDALQIAQKDGHSIKALIVGHEMETGYRNKLEDQARKLGVFDNICFQEFNNTPQDLMQLCDCIVLTTDRETFGLVLPEAMRAGVAVIGSKSGGVPEIIEHRKTGLLFETKNAVSLHQQLTLLYLDTDYKNKLAQQGKHSADLRFNEISHFQQLEQHMKTVANIK